MESLPNGNETSSLLQRILIGAGAFIVVALTIVAAVFLAMQDTPEEPTPISTSEPITTPTVQINPTVTNTVPPTLPPDTPTSPPPPTEILEPAPTTALPSPPTEEPATPVASTESPTTEEPATTVPSTEPPTSTFTPIPPPTKPIALTNCGVPPPAGWEPYTVESNDTFESLADRTDSSVVELQESNCLRNIQSGDIIYLPIGNPPVPTEIPTSVGATKQPPATPKAPRISTVTVHQTGDKILLIVTGENFRSQENGFIVKLVGPTVITMTVGGAGTSASFEASASIPTDLPVSLPVRAYDLVVVNPSGRLDVQEGVYPPATSTPTLTPTPTRTPTHTPTSTPTATTVP